MAAKRCPKCGEEKPLTVEHWLPRADSRDGFRGYCRLCWYAQQRPGKRRHYQRHGERIRAERRADRQRRPHQRRMADLRYYLKNRERRLAYNRRYYWLNHERILRQKRLYDATRRPLRIDMGLEMPTDRNVDLYLWQLQQDRKQAQQSAAAILRLTMQALTVIERQLLLAFESSEYNLTAAAMALNISVGTATKLMGGIRNAASRARDCIAD